MPGSTAGKQGRPLAEKVGLFLVSLIAAFAAASFYGYGNPAVIALIACLVCTLYKKAFRDPPETRVKVLLAVFAAALGTAAAVTARVHFKNIVSGPDENYLLMNPSVLSAGLCVAFLMYPLLLLLFHWIQNQRLTGTVTAERHLSERAFFLLTWGAIFICWIPYLLTFYPAGVVGDGAEALEYVIDPSRMDARWVVASILSLRFFVWLGNLFGQDIHTGLFLYALVSSLIYSSACAMVVSELRKRGVPGFLVMATAAMYALSGHFASYGMCLWKDGLFAAGLVALVLLLWRYPQEGKPDWKYLIRCGLLVLFLCLWRNNICYVVLSAGILMILIRRGRMKALAAVMIGIAAVTAVIQGPVYRALNYTENGIAETMAIPIQQVAAAIQGGAEITEEQAEVLYKLLPREEWISHYTPTLCDSVKFRIDEQTLRTYQGDFLKIWLQLMPRYFPTYIKAHLMETLGFWQPYGSNQGFYHDYFLGIQDIYERGYYGTDWILQATGYSIRPTLLMMTPFIPSGTLVWILLFSLTIVFCQKRRGDRRLIVLLPFTACWLTVLFSAPMAYTYRYVEMLALGMPLFLMIPFIRSDGTIGGTMQAVSSAEKERVENIHGTGKQKRLLTIVLAAGIVTLLLNLGNHLYPAYHFVDGQIEIRTAGEDYTANYYDLRGLSANEGEFSWTNANDLTLRMPRFSDSDKIDVRIHVVNTFNGEQRYEVYNVNGILIYSGSIDSEGEIHFVLKDLDDEIEFALHLPDAIVVSNVIPGNGDKRKIALQIDRIILTEQ